MTSSNCYFISLLVLLIIPSQFSLSSDLFSILNISKRYHYVDEVLNAVTGDSRFELFVADIAYQGPIYELHPQQIETWCRSAEKITYLTCVSDLKEQIYNHLIRQNKNITNNYNNIMTGSIKRLYDVYTSLYVTEVPAVQQSICLFGEYSTQILSTLMMINANKVIRILLNDESKLSSDQLIELQSLFTISYENGIELLLYDSYEALTGLSCNVIHIRGDSTNSKDNPSIVDVIVAELFLKDCLQDKNVPIIWEKFQSQFRNKVNSLNNYYYVVESVNINVKWKLRAVIADESSELLIGDAIIRNISVFHTFRSALSSECYDNCYYFNGINQAIHYRNYSNEITAMLYNKLRSVNYTVDIDLHSINNHNTEKLSNTYTDPASVLLFVSFCYNGEPIVALHLEYLYSYVDSFIIIESRTTFSGRKKDELYINKYYKIFEPYLDKIQFIVINSFPSPPADWIEIFQNLLIDSTQFKKSNKTLEEYSSIWFREQYQRNLVADFLCDTFYYTNNQKYLLIITDVDEIVALPETNINVLKSKYELFAYPYYVSMDFFYYNFNFIFPTKWTLTFFINDIGVTTTYPLSLWRTIKSLRTVLPIRGWHLSYFSSIYSMVKKIESFSHSEFDSPSYKNITSIKERVTTGVDIFARENVELLKFIDWSSLPDLFVSFHPIVMRYQSDLSEDSHRLHATIWICIGSDLINSNNYVTLAYGVKDALVGIGFNNNKVKVVNGIDLVEYDRLYKSGYRDVNEDGLLLQIVIGNPLDQILLLPKYLVVSISESNVVTIKESSKDGVVIPQFASSVMTNPKSPTSSGPTTVTLDGMSNNNKLNEFIDILYLTSSKVNDVDRIENLLSSQSSKDKKTKLHILTRRLIEDTTTLHMNDVTVREQFIVHSKVIVVARETDQFDEALINYLFALGKCVVYVDNYSNNNRQPLELPHQYGQGALSVISGSIEDLYVVCKSLVMKKDKRQRLQDKATEIHKTIQSDTGKLKSVVFAFFNDDVL